MCCPPWRPHLLGLWSSPREQARHRSLPRGKTRWAPSSRRADLGGQGLCRREDIYHSSEKIQRSRADRGGENFQLHGKPPEGRCREHIRNGERLPFNVNSMEACSWPTCCHLWDCVWACEYEKEYVKKSIPFLFLFLSLLFLFCFFLLFVFLLLSCRCFPSQRSKYGQPSDHTGFLKNSIYRKLNTSLPTNYHSHNDSGAGLEFNMNEHFLDSSVNCNNKESPSSLAVSPVERWHFFFSFFWWLVTKGFWGKKSDQQQQHRDNRFPLPFQPTFFLINGDKTFYFATTRWTP